MDIRDFMERRKIDKGKKMESGEILFNHTPQRQQESWPSIASIQSYISSEVVDKARRRKGKGLRRDQKPDTWKVETGETLSPEKK